MRLVGEMAGYNVWITRQDAFLHRHLPGELGRCAMAAISVRNLRKTFAVRRKGAGLAGSLRALVRPDTHLVEAVRGLSFEMEPGELLGFIGPNGAGKSTFEGSARLLLFTLMPAALMGSVPAAFVRGFGWPELGLLLAGAGVFLSLATVVFRLGLRRYESGSAITTQL